MTEFIIHFKEGLPDRFETDDIVYMDALEISSTRCPNGERYLEVIKITIKNVEG